MANIDPRLYGRAESHMALTDAEVGQQIKVAEPPVVGGPTVDVSQIPTGQADLAAQQRMSGASFIAPNLLEGVGAAIQGWDTTSAVKSLFLKPSFPDDKPDAPTLGHLLPNIPFELTKPEFEVLQQSKSHEERMWYVEQWREHREAGQVAAEFPIANVLTQVIDPAYLVIGGPMARLASTIKTAPRVAGAVLQGTGALAISEAASRTHPITTGEKALMVLANAAGGAAIVRNGKVTLKDPDFPADELADALKPHLRMVTPAKYVTDDFGTRVKVKDAVFEEVPKPLRADAAVHDPVEIAQAVETHMENVNKTWGQKFGEFISWNTNKTMRSLSKDGDSVGNTLLDNNLEYGLTSVESHKVAIMRDLARHQVNYEDKLLKALTEDGFGVFQRIWAKAEVRAAQAKIENDVAMEMMRREQLSRMGRPISFDAVPARIKAMADDLDKLGLDSVAELKAAGVFGAENLAPMKGYFHRVWSSAKMEDLLGKFKKAGQTEAQARKSAMTLLRGSLRRANNWDDELAGDVAHAIIDRTMRKGMLDDGIMAANLGKGAAKEVRDMLKSSGLSEQRIDRVIGAITGKTDEAGKTGYLKHRVDLDYTAQTVINGEVVRVTDLLETNISTITERYLHGVSAQAAFARKGLVKNSDIGAMRERYIAGAPDRNKAAKMFDNVINHLQGKPVGEEMNETLRNAAGFNRMITLGASGIWQASEYAKMMQRYGMLKTLKYMTAEMPVFKEMMKVSANPKTSGQLKDILTGMSDQQLRMRPYIQRFEDNFEMPKDSRVASFIQQGTQAVPYLNGMKYIHAHQARVHANLVIDTIKRAVHGDAAAAGHLKAYGLESRGMDKLKAAFKQHGANVDNWDDAAWAAVRPALNKMVDESVLHARLGDVPAFAAMDNVGKFIFTYRSFVLTAHNKVLAGTLSREGLGAASLLMIYQYPLAMLATQANTVVQGKPALNQDELLTKSLGQMGALGLGGEIASVLTGSKRSVGAPGLIPWDRAYSLAGSAASATVGDGSASKVAQDAAALVPFFSLIPGNKALTHLED